MNKGKYRVTQLGGKEVFCHDFDAEEWEYRWYKRGDGVVILRLEHINDPDAVDSFDFVEYSAPVNVEFTYE